MREMEATSSLQPMFEGAKQFGLTDGEVLQSLDHSLREVGDEATVGELVDELAGALARTILGKEQRAPAEDRL
ncbi:MAG TPA: hypothetical protein VEY33_08540 [Gemmatimonadota bacterium]|nr:hypothetical protein [Gemmatimonadota bacterium]